VKIGIQLLARGIIQYCQMLEDLYGTFHTDLFSHLISISSPEDTRVPASLACHLADVYLEELDKVLANAESLPAPLSIVLAPFFALMAHTSTNATYKHIQSVLMYPLFVALSPKENDPTRSGKRARLDAPTYENIVGRGCLLDPLSEGRIEAAMLRNALSLQIFEVASQDATRPANRKRMYAFWKELTDASED
jgi:ribosomal RNA-processing protein 1